MKMKNMYLTDEQYKGLLTKVETLIPQFSVFQVMDNIEPGNKSTTSTVGLCKEELTEADTALFPDLFHQGRKTMKYRESHHICPFDSRLKDIERNAPVNMFNGCYYTCLLQRPITEQAKVMNLVERTIAFSKETNAKERVEQLTQRYFSLED